jgi:VanZ family protein
MALIFLISTDVGSSTHTSRLLEPFLRWLIPGISAHALDWAHTIARKGGHATGYAVLSLLLLRAIRKTSGITRKEWSWRAAQWALFVTIVYAASDEFHQSFVASRTASVGDVFIDTGGGILALALGFVVVKSKQTSIRQEDPNCAG